MRRPGTETAARAIAAGFAAAVLAAALGGSSDLYLARRDTLTPSAGDAIAANTALQTVDPWPRLSGNPNFPFNGQRMQAAVERYREGKVTKPVDAEQGVAGTAQNVTPPSTGGGSTPAPSSSP